MGTPLEKINDIFKALSDKNRIRIVHALAHYEELCACQLIELLQLKGATVSRHLGILVHSGLMASRKNGRWVYYRLLDKDNVHLPLLDWFTHHLEQDNDLMNDLQHLERITASQKEDLCRKQRGEDCCP